MQRQDTSLLLAAMLAAGCLPARAQTVAVSFCSTEGTYWRMQTETVRPAVGKANVVIRTDQPAQTFKGWGTCFNELDYDAWSLLPDDQQTLFVRRAFNPNGDLRLTIGRIPVGASDYANDWYSCDETEAQGTNPDGTTDYATDFDMEHFTIQRDRQKIIPSIKLAQAQQPAMTFWASPWSPPSWMKVNKHYAQRPTDTNGCPFGVPPYANDQFIDRKEYYDAYCLYFDKFVEAYRQEGIPVTAIAYQNEAYSNTPYPGCSWTAATTAKFLGQYLGPYMREHQPGLDLIVGTMNTASWDVFQTILADPAVQEYCPQVGFQWEGRQQIARVREAFPQFGLVQTESECGSGTFDWAAAAHTFELCNHYLANGASAYTYWNAILKDRGNSTWGWVQNALVQVNTPANTARYCPEFYAYKHYTHLIGPGARILQCDQDCLLTSALSADGYVVVVVGNDGMAQKTLTLDIDGQALVCRLPAKSFTTYAVGSKESIAKMLSAEAQGLVDVEGASLTAARRDDLAQAVADGSYDRLLHAVEAVEGCAEGRLRNPDFADGAEAWTTDNVAQGGDFRAAQVMGRTCYNNWSDNFTSLDIHQDVRGLQPGIYAASALSLCGEGNITDQHVYLSTQAYLAKSPVKADDVWGEDHWERQETPAVYVAEGETLRVGYAATGGGGTRGWFCATGFQLRRLGDLTPDFDLTANRRPDPMEAARADYETLAGEARLLAVDEAYDATCRQQLDELIRRQKALLSDMDDPALAGNLQRELQDMMDTVRANPLATTLTPAQPADGDFLLYDLDEQKFLSYTADSPNLPRLSSRPARLLLTRGTDGSFAIRYADVDYLKIGTWNNLFVFGDAASEADTRWTFVPVGGKADTYLLRTDSYAEQAVTGTFYLTGANASTVPEEAHEFMLVSPQDYIAQAGDATFMLRSAAVTAATTGGWTRLSNSASGYAERPAAVQSSQHSGYGISHWAATPPVSTDLIRQQVEGLPAGTYRLKAFAAATQWNNNAGGDNRSGVSLFAQSATACGQTPVTSPAYAAYTVYCTVREGETLTVGLRADAANQNNWNFLSDATLEYLGQRLVLDENYHEAPSGQDADVMLRRTFYEGWNSLVLPFSLTREQVADLLGEDAEVATLLSAAFDGEDADIKFRISQGVEANLPCLVYVGQDVTVSRTIAHVDCQPQPSTAAVGEAFSLVGTYAAYDRGTSPLTAQDFILGSEDTFLPATEGHAIKAYRAYLKANAPLTARPAAIRFTLCDTETGIPLLQPDSLSFRPGNPASRPLSAATGSRQPCGPVLYDLAGRRVSIPDPAHEGSSVSASSTHARGIYIFQGRKIVL